MNIYKICTFCFYVHFSLFPVFRYIFHKTELKLNIKHLTETFPIVLLHKSEKFRIKHITTKLL